jgi:hypothetical protein
VPYSHNYSKCQATLDRLIEPYGSGACGAVWRGVLRRRRWPNLGAIARSARKARCSLRQPSQPQTLRVALEIFRSAQSCILGEGRQFEPRIKLQGTSQRFLRLIEPP